ncbi:Aldehyde dehydrogenase-like protein 6 [Elsinoe fawcettii]|nr:Aldehyde dehydrogenase-like protein 6 [Elsinoe fawcettii]
MVAKTSQPFLPLQPFIGGKYIEPRSKEKFALRSTVDDTVITDALHNANAEDVEVAVQAAEKAFPSWSKVPARQRRDIMLKFADLLIERRDDIAYWDCLLTGKTVTGAHYEVDMAAEGFRYYAGMIDKLQGESIPSDDEGILRIVRQEPLGVCAGITAFNGPLGLFAFKTAPALAAGNVMIIKASETNPFSTLVAAGMTTQAGFPPGVINVLVGGPEAGDALARHMRIRKISFTGSGIVGKKIQAAAAQSNLKRVTLELGGKSPLIVFDDADLAEAIQGASVAIAAMNGQICIMGSRVYVHEAIADKFVQGLKVAYEQMAGTLGADPLNKDTMTSPIFHHRQFQSVLDFLEKGKAEAELISGGTRHGDKGAYIKPTIFYNPKPDAEIVQKEIFGPVVVVQTFKDEEDMIKRANDTEYGLAAYLFTKNVDKAIRVSNQLEAGNVGVNTALGLVDWKAPFGGHKGSGVGQENGLYVLRHYTQPKTVTIKYQI